MFVWFATAPLFDTLVRGFFYLGCVFLLQVRSAAAVVVVAVLVVRSGRRGRWSLLVREHQPQPTHHAHTTHTHTPLAHAEQRPTPHLRASFFLCCVFWFCFISVAIGPPSSLFL